MVKKIISAMFLIIIVFACCPVFAANVTSGTCGADGSNITWTLSSRGVLTISGQGEMADYASAGNESPWQAYRQGGYITKIVINNGVTSIGNYCFNYCINVTSVTLPASLRGIGKNAFLDCRSLSSITLNTGLETIGDYAFHGCNDLQSLNIPGTVTSIGKHLSNYLLSINVDSNNQIYKSIDGVLFSKDGKELIYFPPKRNISAYTIPTGTENICEGAFYGSELDNIYMPDTVTQTGWDAFAYSQNLTSMRLSENLKEFKGQTFSYCTSLKELYIPNSVKSMTATNNYWEFPGCRDLVITVDNVKGGIRNGEAQFASSNVSSVTYLRELYVPDIDDCEFGTIPDPDVIERSVDTKEYIKTLAKNKDYSVKHTFENGIGEAQITYDFQRAGSDYVEAEKIVKTYNILSPELEISPIEDKFYTGYSIMPDVIITNKTTNTTLTAGTDFKCKYTNNKEIGRATIEITYINNYANYSGDARAVEFNILGDIRLVGVSLNEPAVYTGKTLTPKLKLTGYGKTLVDGVDYSVSYIDNINAGTATATITGKGYFVNSRTYTFTISPKSCDGLKIESIPNSVFTGKAIKPSVTITDTEIN